MLDELGQDVVLICLRFEFGAGLLEETYCSGPGSLIFRQLSERASFQSPHLLALWFGADERTPSAKTWYTVNDRIAKTLHLGLSKADFFSQTCRLALANWAARHRYDSTKRTDRKRSIFASSSTLDPARRPRAARVSLKDFNHILSSNQPAPVLHSRTISEEEMNPSLPEGEPKSLPAPNESLGNDGKPVEGNEDNPVEGNGGNPVEGNDGNPVEGASLTNALDSIIVASSSNLATVDRREPGRPVQNPWKSVVMETTSDDSIKETSKASLAAAEAREPAAAMPQREIASSRLRSTAVSTVASGEQEDTTASPLAMTFDHKTVNPFHESHQVKMPSALLDVQSNPGSGQMTVTGHKRPQTEASTAQEAIIDVQHNKPLSQSVPSTPVVRPAITSRHYRTPSSGSIGQDATFSLASLNSSSSVALRSSAFSTTSQGLSQTPMTVFSDNSLVPDSGCKRRADSDPMSPPAHKKPNRGLQNTSLVSATDSTVARMISAGEQGNPIMVERVQSRDIKILELRDIVTKSLQQEKAWLGGETVDHFVQMAAFSQRSFTTVTALMLEETRVKDRPENMTFAQRFVDPITRENVASVLVPVCVGGDHWVIVFVDRTRPIVRLYNSQSTSDTQRENVGLILNTLKPFFSFEISDLELPKCAHQNDGYNCGVFAIVNAFCLAGGIPPPSALNGSLWRRLLLAMSTESSLASVLPRSLLSVDISAGGLETHVEDQPRTVLPAEALPLDIALTFHRRAVAMATAYRDRCIAREREADEMVTWVEQEVVPISSSLMSAAAAEIQRLAELLGTWDVELQRLKSIFNPTPCFSIEASTMDRVRRELDQAMRLHKIQRQRQMIAEMTAKAFRVLEVDEVLVELRNTRDGYRDQITKAQQMLETGFGG